MSGFVDDVMFSRNGLWCVVCIPKRQENTTSLTGEIPTKFCSPIKTGSTHCEGGEVRYLRLPCFVVSERGSVRKREDQAGGESAEEHNE